MIKEEQFLNFDKLKIYQDDKMFKYNLDSILLADFVTKHYKRGKIIDLATGNIPIPLFLSYRLKQKITAVELQKEVFDLGIKTIKRNKLEESIKLIHEDIRNLKSIFPINSFDVVVCNPPYFKVEGNKKLSQYSNKALARHELTLCIQDIITISKYLLNNKGSLFLIYRTERIVELLSLLHDHNLEPKVIRVVYSNTNASAKLFLIEARLNGSKGCLIENPLIIYNNTGEYTKEIIKMFGDDCNDTEEL